MRGLALAALAAVLILSSGCGSMIFHPSQTVIVDGPVTGGVRAPDTGKACSLPGQMELDRSKDHRLVVVFDGPQKTTRTMTLRSEWSWWRIGASLVLNAGHGFFTLFITTAVGVYTDFSSGAWQCLERDRLTLSPDQPDEPAAPPPAPPSREASAAAPRAGFCRDCGARVSGAFCGSCGARAK